MSATSVAVEFVRSIGIECELREGSRGFLPGIRIRRGRLEIDPKKVYSGDVLHEAGHLAILPARFRPRADMNIDGVARLMVRALRKSDPESDEVRALLQCGDCEATAWAWAAGEHLQLKPQQVIRIRDYSGEGGYVRFMLAARSHMGIHGLAAARWCVTRPALEQVFGLPAYPKLARWLQP